MPDAGRHGDAGRAGGGTVSIVDRSGSSGGCDVEGCKRRLAVKLRSPIKPGFDSAIRKIMFCPPVGYPGVFKLESGAVELIALVGITRDEAQYSRENDGEKLVELLARAGAFPLTDPARKSVISTLR